MPITGLTTPPSLSRADLARLFLFVQEVPQGSNKGRWVEALQRLGNTTPGEPWCMCLVVAVQELYHHGRNPLPNIASCETVHTFAKTKGWVSQTPRPDDIYLVRNTLGVAHHTGIVASVSDDLKTIHEISGNTNLDGSREGYGVFERDRLVTPSLVFIHIPPDPL